MDVQKKLDEIVGTVGSAKSMPMSASCVVNRAELLAKLEELRMALPGSLAQAQEVIGDRDQMVAAARQEAQRIIESAHSHRGSLISQTEVARQSQEEADRILAEARREAEEIRAEADDYVDSKLANFEVVLTKTIGSVDRGREKLLGRGPGAYGDDENGQYDQAPERSADPETLRHRADEYVDAKLGAVAAVLAKTLEAVGRGRQKLLGTEEDELGAHMAAQDAAGAAGLSTSDDDYLADLATSQHVADPRVPAPTPAHTPAPAHAPAPVHQPPMPAQQPMLPQQPPAPPEAPAQPEYADYYAQAGYQQDAYGYQQQYPQQDPYAAQPTHDYQQPAAAAPQPAGDYGWQQPQHGYDPHTGYAEPQPLDGHQPPQQPRTAGTPALDETSLFDTSMINLDQLRQYEQGR
ncbi:cell division initiation protein [Streptomyces sp. AC536]|uniref:ATP synthase F0 subunit B n=1 Tax=Streptomyces buecherae TaxID=2763006 RepID=UPI00164D5AEC|nr:ATP synthase F0 subunit B [Streptomyces buecherae]MBC3985258.1 cell division initiation protein [Streptomyces buecherae]QNJ44186.1 cell division initiation protein [Streptomyces buecherae]